MNGCATQPLGDLCDMSIKGDTNTKDISNTGEYPFYKASVSNPSGSHNKFCFNHKEEYILFIKSGGNAKAPLSSTHGIGKVYLVKGKTCGNTEVAQLVTSILDIKYLYYVLQDKQIDIQKLAKYSVNLGHVDMKEFKKMEICVPSADLQNKSIQIYEEKEIYLNKIDTNIEENKRYVEELKKLGKNIISHFCNQNMNSDLVPP